jgi:hypothetical protein
MKHCSRFSMFVAATMCLGIGCVSPDAGGGAAMDGGAGTAGAAGMSGSGGAAGTGAGR